MFQITLVAEIITLIQPTVATLENTLAIPNYLPNFKMLKTRLFFFKLYPDN